MRPGVFGLVVQDVLATGAAVRFKAAGASMSPTIRDGEAITAVPVAPSEIARGDILLCRCAGRLLAHRVVGVTEERGSIRALRLRGDAKIACDAPVETADVIGRVTTVHRGPWAIPLCGRAARLRQTMRVAVSRARRTIRPMASDRGERGTMTAQ